MSSESCSLQLQMLTQMDSYEFFISPSEMASVRTTERAPSKVIKYLCYLFCKERDFSKSTLSDLDNLLPGALLKQKEEMKDEIRKYNKLIPELASDYEKFEQFLQENLPKITLWYAESLKDMEKQDDNSDISYLMIFLNKLEKASKVLGNTDHDHVTIFTPKQIIDSMCILIPQTSNKIKDITQKGDFSKVKSTLSQFSAFLDDLKIVISNAQLKDSFLLADVSLEELYKFRATISDFCLLTGCIDIISQDSFLSGQVADLLYQIDVILSYRSALTKNSASAIDISRAALHTHLSLNAILDNSTETNIVMLKQHLLIADKLFKDISIAFEEIVVVKPPIIRLLKYFKDMAEQYDFISTQFIQDGYTDLAFNFTLSYYILVNVLNNVQFADEKLLANLVPIDPEYPISFEQKIKDSDEKIQQISIKGVYQADKPDLIQYLVNPSKKTKSSVKTAYYKSNSKLKEEKLEKLFFNTLEELKKTQESLLELQINNSSCLDSLSALNNQLLQFGCVVDLYNKSSKSEEYSEIENIYFDTIIYFNSIIETIINQHCIDSNAYTPLIALRCSSKCCDLILKIIEMISNEISTGKADTKSAKSDLTKLDATINSILKNYSESNLIKNKGVFADVAKYLEKYQNESHKFDKSIRESYLKPLYKELLICIYKINEFNKNMIDKAYTTQDVIEDLNTAEDGFKKLTHLLLCKRSLSTKLVTESITNIIEPISLIRTSLTFGRPKQYLKIVTSVREKLESLPIILNSVLFNFNDVSALDYVSFARWKLGHLEQDYHNDEQLVKLLQSAVMKMTNAQKNAKDSSIISFFHEQNKELLPIIKYHQYYSERFGDEEEKYIKLFTKIIYSIGSNWNPSLSADTRSSFIESRNLLNEAIFLLKGDKVKLEDLGEHKFDFNSSFLNSYISAAAPKITDKIFYDEARKSESIKIPADINTLEVAIQKLDEYINTNKCTPQEFQDDLMINLLYVLAAAKKSRYGEYDGLMELASKFISQPPESINNYAYELSYHAHAVYEKAVPQSKKKKVEIEQFLLSSYLAKNNSNLAETAYYTRIYAPMRTKREDRKEFENLLPQMCKCVHEENQISEIDFEIPIKLLKASLPSSLHNILSTSEEEAFLFWTPPLVAKKNKDVSDLTTSEAKFSYGWIKKCFQNNGYDFYYNNKPSHKRSSDAVPYYNEQNIPKDNIDRSNYIHIPLVGKLIRNMSNPHKDNKIIANEIGTYFESLPLSHSIIVAPPPPSKTLGYLNLELNKLLINGMPVEGVLISFYILDDENDKPLCQPVYATTTADGSVKFLYQNANRAVLQISSHSSCLVCRLYHKSVDNLDEFINRLNNKTDIKATGTLPINFAFSAFPLFDDDGQFDPIILDRFHIVSSDNKNNCDSNLLEFIDIKTEPMISVALDANIGLNEEIGSSYFNVWAPKTNESTLFSASSLTKVNPTNPILTFSSLRFNEIKDKKKKYKYCYFTAILTDSDGKIMQPKPNKSAVTYDSDAIQNTYTSTKAPIINNSVVFPDIVQFVIDHKMIKIAHVLIHLYFDDKQPVLYKVGTIPLLKNSHPIETASDVEYQISKLKKYPETGYLNAKLKMKSSVKVNMVIPDSFIISTELTQLMKATPETQLKEFKRIKSEDISRCFDTVFSKYLEILSPASISSLIDLLNVIDHERLLLKFEHFIFHNFRPDSYGNDFYIKYFRVLTEFIKQHDIENYDEFSSFLKHIDIFLGVGLSTIIIKHASDENAKYFAKPEFSKVFTEFTQLITKLITKYLGNDSSIHANKVFSEFMFYSEVYVDPSTFMKAFELHLKSCKPEYSTSTMVSIQYKFDFISQFTGAFVLMAHATRFGNPFKEIFNAFEEALEKKHDSNWILMMHSFVSGIEAYKTICPKIANVWIPYLNIAMKYYQKVSDLKIFLTPALFVLYSAEKDTLIEFFKRSQNHVIDFLRDCHKYIQNDLLFLYEFSSRTLSFIDVVSGSANKKALLSIIKLIFGLMNENGRQELYPDALLVMSRLADRHPEILFKSENNILNTFIKKSLDMLPRKLWNARCSSCALIIHFNYVSHIKTMQINTMTKTFLNHFVPAATTCDMKIFPLYLRQVDVMKQFMLVFRARAFVEDAKQHLIIMSQVCQEMDKKRRSNPESNEFFEPPTYYDFCK